MYSPLPHSAKLVLLGLLLSSCQALQIDNPISFANLHEIKVGDSQDQVRQRLGEPHTVNYFKRLNETVWAYQHPLQSEGTFLIGFKNGETVTSINVAPFATNFSLSD